MFCFFRRNNSARELSAFAESAMAVNRVVLQHMSINLVEEHDASEETPSDEAQSADIEEDSNKENVLITDHGSNKQAEKRKAPPFGLSPPSESKLIQRRRQQSSQSLNFSCRTKSNLTKNSSDYLVADLVSPNYVESPGC